MKMFKKLMSMMMVVVIATSFAACGSKNEPSPSGKSTSVETASSESFPKFKGTDFDGKAVDETMFKENNVTVLNFWFNGCSACVSEIPSLEKFKKTLEENGAQLVGLNVEANSSEDKLKEAKDILSKQGATYRNIMINGEKEADDFLNKIMAFPTTILVDKNGKIIGKPIIGVIDDEKSQNKILEMIKKASSGESTSNETIDPSKATVEKSPEATGTEEGEVDTSEIVALNEEINKLLDDHNEVWNKILANAPKEKAAQIDKEISYADYLNEALEKSKESLNSDEQKLAKKDIEKISELDNKIKALTDAQ